MSGQALGGIFPALVNILVIAVQVCSGLFLSFLIPFSDIVVELTLKPVSGELKYFLIPL